MNFQIYGDRAMLISFEQKIDEDVNDRVLGLHHAIQAASVPGIVFYIPAYCSLTVGYDPLITNYDALCKKIRDIAQNMTADAFAQESRCLNIPVCYDDAFALDIEDVTEETGLSKKEIIDLHTNTAFRVYMMGFLPGFAYLGKLPEALYCPRKKEPRLKVPPQSVGIAGYQTGIYPSEAPGGWQIIGKTPINLFNSEKKNPFLCRPGDRITFCSISKASFHYIETAIASGSYNIQSVYE